MQHYNNIQLMTSKSYFKIKYDVRTHITTIRQTQRILQEHDITKKKKKREREKSLYTNQGDRTEPIAQTHEYNITGGPG